MKLTHIDQVKLHLSQDMVLKPIIKDIVLPEISIQENIFKELVESIIYQQLSTKVASVIAKRFYELLETDNPQPRDVLKYDVHAKRAVGLSYAKANYIENIATYWIENDLHDTDWNQKEDDEIISILTQIKGVGKWTAEMTLMFPLCREDVFPYVDLAIKTQIMALYQLSSSKKELLIEMNAIAEQWRPYRSYACRYLWKSKDQK